MLAVLSEKREVSIPNSEMAFIRVSLFSCLRHRRPMCPLAWSRLKCILKCRCALKWKLFVWREFSGRWFLFSLGTAGAGIRKLKPYLQHLSEGAAALQVCQAPSAMPSPRTRAGGWHTPCSALGMDANCSMILHLGFMENTPPLLLFPPSFSWRVSWEGSGDGKQSGFVCWFNASQIAGD